jgi:hypothetical protein
MTMRTAAVLRLYRVVALPARHPVRYSNPVARADQRTSVADARTALCIAIGVPLDQIHPASGHDMRDDE